MRSGGRRRGEHACRHTVWTLAEWPGQVGLRCAGCGRRVLLTQRPPGVLVDLLADRRGAAPPSLVEAVVHLLRQLGATDRMLESAAVQARGDRRGLFVSGLGLPAGVRERLADALPSPQR